MFKWRPGRVEEENEVRPKKRHMLSPGHVKDSFKTFFKARPDNKRFYILIYVTMLLMYYLPFFGEGAVSYNYVRTRFDSHNSRKRFHSLILLDFTGGP